jgi:hypothetical protein
MDTIDSAAPSVSSRKMLGGVAMVVSLLLLAMQLVLLIFFRIHRETMPSYTGRSVHFALNPLIVWIPLWIGILLIVWWSACRKHAPRRQLYTLILSLGIGIALAITGSLFHIPETYYETPAPPLNDNMMRLPDLPYQ